MHGMPHALQVGSVIRNPEIAKLTPALLAGAPCRAFSASCCSASDMLDERAGSRFHPGAGRFPPRHPTRTLTLALPLPPCYTHVDAAAIADPAANTRECLDTLLATVFVNTVDAPSLALIIPVVHRGLRDRSGARAAAAAAAAAATATAVGVIT